MVSIDNKTNSASNLVGIKQNVSPDEVDMLFAELFALVHSGSNEEYNAWYESLTEEDAEKLVNEYNSGVADALECDGIPPGTFR